MTVPVIQWPSPATATAMSFKGSTRLVGIKSSTNDWYGPSPSTRRRRRGGKPCGRCGEGSAIFAHQPDLRLQPVLSVVVAIVTAIGVRIARRQVFDDLISGRNAGDSRDVR